MQGSAAYPSFSNMARISRELAEAAQTLAVGDDAPTTTSRKLAQCDKSHAPTLAFLLCCAGAKLDLPLFELQFDGISNASIDDGTLVVKLLAEVKVHAQRGAHTHRVC
jgi:hypothetical protein